MLLLFSYYSLLVYLKTLQIYGYLSFFSLLNILTLLQLGARIIIQGGLGRFIIAPSYNIILTSFRNPSRPRISIRITKQPRYRSIRYSFLELSSQQYIIGYFTTYRYFISGGYILGRQRVTSYKGSFSRSPRLAFGQALAPPIDPSGLQPFPPYRFVSYLQRLLPTSLPYRPLPSTPYNLYSAYLLPTIHLGNTTSHVPSSLGLLNVYYVLIIKVVYQLLSNYLYSLTHARFIYIDTTSFNYPLLLKYLSYIYYLVQAEFKA